MSYIVRKGIPFLIALFALPLWAQDPAQFAQAQKENAETLKHYTWKSRTELKLKGESKTVTLDQVRYDLDGKLQKTPISGTPQQEEQPAPGGRGSRLKKKFVEKKKEDFADMLQELVQLVTSYAATPPEKWQSFLQNGTKTPDNGAVRIAGQDLQVPGDSVSIWINPDTAMLRRVEIQTLYDEKPVTVAIEYVTMQEGPTYQARTKLAYPSKELEVTIENYDYQHFGS